MRYEIETNKSGVRLNAVYIKQIVTTKALDKPKVIVFVDDKDTRAFEKHIEGIPEVIAYKADPRQPGKEEKSWQR